MVIFALDSSSRAASAAVMKDGVLLSESYADVGLTHSETLMPLAHEAFFRAGLSPANIDCFAVTAGPGSFTGLRIGVATVKGLAFPNETPCAAVPTLLASAYSCRVSDRLIVPVLDARLGRFFNAGFVFDGTAPRRLWEDRVGDIAELRRELQKHALPVLFLLDGADVCYNELRDSFECAVAPAPLRQIRAGFVAEAASDMCARGETVSVFELAPSYMQLPQAERERQKRLSETENRDK